MSHGCIALWSVEAAFGGWNAIFATLLVFSFLALIKNDWMVYSMISKVDHPVLIGRDGHYYLTFSVDVEDDSSARLIVHIWSLIVHIWSFHTMKKIYCVLLISMEFLKETNCFLCFITVLYLLSEASDLTWACHVLPSADMRAQKWLWIVGWCWESACVTSLWRGRCSSLKTSTASSVMWSSQPLTSPQMLLPRSRFSGGLSFWFPAPFLF